MSRSEFSLAPTDDELERDWTLTEKDVREVCRGARTAAARLLFAVRLCILRARGYLTEDVASICPRILNSLARQLEQEPILFLEAPKREATDLDQERRVREYLGFAIFSEDHATLLTEALRSFVVDQTLSAEDLMGRAEKFLLSHKVVRPATSRLERIIGGVAAATEDSLFLRIAKHLTSRQCEQIDKLLEPPEAGGVATITSLKEPPPSPTPEIILTFLERAKLLGDIEINLDSVDVRAETISHLADRIRRHAARDVRRIMPDVKRHATVACFLRETERQLLDWIVEMHHVYMTTTFRRSKNTNNQKQTRLRAQHRRDIDMVFDSLTKVLDASDKFKTDARVGKEVRTLDLPDVRKSIENCAEFRRLGQSGVVEQLVARHHLVKRYLPELLRLPFKERPGSESLMAAIETARKLHDGSSKALDETTSSEFASGVWVKPLTPAKDDPAPPHSQTWELALADAVRDALRSGDLVLPRSREHAPIASMIYSDERWATEKDAAYVDLGITSDPDRALADIREEYEEEAKALEESLRDNGNPFMKIRAGKLSLTRKKAQEEPPRVKKLRDTIHAHLPFIQIEDLLTDVDSRCHFSAELVPLPGEEIRVKNLYPTILATIVALGTNIGIHAMNGSTNDTFSLGALKSVSDSLIRNETLKAANRVLVDYYNALEFSQIYGNRAISSSDGRHREARRSSLISAIQTRKYGYCARAVNVITHQADFAVFGTRVVSCSAREALYVLDGLLENDTTIAPREHTTDTHGYVEQLFSHAYFHDVAFVPRLAKLKHHKLYRLDRNQSLGRLDPLVTGVVDMSSIHEQWDEFARVAASLKNKTAPAHVVLDRLIASSPADRRSKAMTALGRILKTTYVFRYLRDEMLRDRVSLALSRGEHQHSLVDVVAYGEHGAFTTANPIAMMNRASALSLLCNAILVWNTIRFSMIVKELGSWQHCCEKVR